MLICIDPKPAFDWAPWVQALIYALTLGVLIRQNWLLRKQNRYSDYIRCQMDFGQTFRELLINQQDPKIVGDSYHSKIYDSLNKTGSKFSNWKNYKSEDKLMYGFFEIIYELFERVYCIRENDKTQLIKYGIIDNKEWEYWESWIDDVKKHPIFKDVYEDSKGMFDNGFEELISNKLKEVSNSENNSKA